VTTTCERVLLEVGVTCATPPGFALPPKVATKLSTNLSKSATGT
jgi:hypothetical protein